MFRVDIYNAHEETPSRPPAYVCLATAKDCLLTVGRKNATILFAQDKSVSRDHLHVQLLSQATPHHEPLVCNDSDNQVAAAAVPPNTPEEIDACANSPNGMALRIDNLGKFGSAAIALANANDDDNSNDNKADNAKKNDDGSDTGSDTEDESQEPPPKTGLPTINGVTWFPSTQKLVQEHIKQSTGVSSQVVIPKKLDGNESFVVPGNATKVIVQVGQTGSMLLLTRMNLTFVKSSLPKKQQTLWSHRLYAIGATLLDNGAEAALLERRPPHQKKVLVSSNGQPEPSPPTLYLVTEKRESTGKILAAWNLNIPIVLPDFWEALLVQRKSPDDPWPDPTQFLPRITEHKKADNTFWQEKQPTNPFLWKACTLLSTHVSKSSEHELLVSAAGGTVVVLHGMSQDEAKAKALAVCEDPEQKPGCFGVLPTGKSRKPALLTWLEKQGVPMISAFDLAQCLCQQEVLKDGQGRAIRGAIAEEQMEEEDVPAAIEDNSIASQQQQEEDKTASKPSRKDSEDDADALKKHVPSSASKRKRRVGDDETTLREEKEERTRKSPRRDRPRKSQELSPVRELDGDEEAVQDQEEARHRLSRKNKRETRHDEEDDVAAGARSKQSQSGDHGDEVGVKSKGARPSKKAKPEPMGSARLGTTADGWMVVAPKNDARRQAFLRPRDEYALDDSAPVEADTVVCSGLIQRAYQPQVVNTVKRAASGKDFKRFRKNRVLRVPAHCRIELRSILPKETVRQRELQEAQRELEAQQRLADELFGASGGAKNSTSRKRR